ncbi:hypothetical protein BASA81_005372 [Batrachochytrium salamandrivorans]|nr:hypothetical protein BASA81_005372 [Batrachochytrium salamandrivorans]
MPTADSPLRVELTPFPLRGISLSHLSDLQEEISNSFVKVSCRCFGKSDIAPKPLGRLLEKVGGILTGSGAKLEVVHSYTTANPQGERDTVLVTFILATKTSIPLSEVQNSSRIRELLKTQVHRQAASRKLGEDAELVPFAGFSLVEISPELDLTTREVCQVFVLPQTLSLKQSYVQIRGETTGAGTLVMHCWNDPFKSIYSSLEAEFTGQDFDRLFVWLDLFSINQHVHYLYSSNWLTTQFCDALGQIGSALLVLPNWKEPTVLTRAWVVWELLACVQQGIELNVIMPPSQRESFDQALFLDLPFLIKQCFSQIDTQNSRSADAYARMQILNCIRDSVGFEGANLVVKDRLLEWLSVVSEQTSRDPEKTKDLLATSQFCFSLAKILSAGQGKHAEAEQMLRKAVDIRTIQLGAEHDSTTDAQIALANVFRAQGKSAEAEVTLRRVCENLAKAKGAEHDDTLLALATLSRVLVDRGVFEEAEEMCQDNLLVLEPKYGLQDKRTIETLVILSQLADLRADSDLAAERLRKALQGYTLLFGEEDAQTLNCQADLAGFLAELENFDEAEELFRASSDKLSGLLGPTHEWTVKAATGLGVLLKVRENLGPNYTPGKFSTKSVFELEENAAGLDPGLDKAIHSMRTTRHTRHEKIKQSEQVKKTAASRKHLRGWLEKLPMELSQREKERQLKQHDSGMISRSDSPPIPTIVEDSQPKPKNMLLKMMSGMGSTKFLDKAVHVVTARRSLVSVSDEAQRKLVWEKRFFQMQSNQKHSSMVYWLTEDDCRNGRDSRNSFDLDDYTSRIFDQSPFGELCFSITGPKGRLHLRALSAESKQEWIQVFKAALAFRGAADKAQLFTGGGGADKDFTASFVNMDSLLQSQHSTTLLPVGEGEDTKELPPQFAGGVSAMLRADMDGMLFD